MINFDTTKKTVEDFFLKMTFDVQSVYVMSVESSKEGTQAIEIFVKVQEPQVLIGEKGRTMLEIQKVLAMILCKKFGEVLYVNLDINDYKKKKTEYLKRLARDLAQDVAFSKKEKLMPPMPAFERRVIHSELADNPDVKTESRGQGPERCVVVAPK